jgi:predicted outer membrane repeat protein
MVTDESFLHVIPGAKFLGLDAGSFGGAFNIYKSDATVTGADFTDCSAGDSGGALFVEVTGEIAVADSNFTGNSATQEGGAIVCLTTAMKIAGSRFVGNTAKWGGGALSIKDGSNATVRGSVFLNNSAKSTGGAIYFWAGEEPLAVTDCLFKYNHARQFGGAVSAQDASIDLNGCKFIENTAEMSGGVSGGMGVGVGVEGVDRAGRSEGACGA